MVLGQLFASGSKILTSKNVLSKTVPRDHWPLCQDGCHPLQ